MEHEGSLPRSQKPPPHLSVSTPTQQIYLRAILILSSQPCLCFFLQVSSPKPYMHLCSPTYDEIKTVSQNKTT